MAAGTHSKCHARSGGRVGDVTASRKLRFPRHAGPPHLCQDHASSLLHSKESQSGRFADRLSHSLFLISRFNAARPALHCIPFPFPIMAAVPECSRSVRAISCSCDVGSCVRPSASVRVRPWPAPFRRPLAPVGPSSTVPLASLLLEICSLSVRQQGAAAAGRKI